MKYTQLHKMAKYAAENNIDELRETLARAIAEEKKDWKLYGNQFLRFLSDGVPTRTIFARGNSKLPFLAFSVLPFVTCPGMGACEAFCYSAKAWRQPAAFYRQLQNTLLLAQRRYDVIAEAMRAELALPRYKGMDNIEFRLYVDGDHDSQNTLNFWMSEFLPSFPQLRAYGYSKSYELFLDYDVRVLQGACMWPKNYVLNMSDGSRYDTSLDILSAMRRLPIVRGDFKVIALPKHEKFSAKNGDWKTKAYRIRLRAAIRASGYEGKYFPCPGQCGSCTGAGHVCGNAEIKIPVFAMAH